MAGTTVKAIELMALCIGFTNISHSDGSAGATSASDCPSGFTYHDWYWERPNWAKTEGYSGGICCRTDMRSAAGTLSFPPDFEVPTRLSVKGAWCTNFASEF